MQRSRFCTFTALILFSTSQLLFPCILDANERARGDGSKISQLSQKADSSIKQGLFEQAQASLKELMKKEVVQKIGPRLYVEILLNRAIVEKELGNLEEASKYLQALHKYKLAPSQRLKAELAGAHILSETNRSNKAFVHLNKLTLIIPFSSWPAEEQAFFASLEQQLNRQFQTLYRQAKRMFDNALFAEAIPVYQKILEGFEQGEYPAALKKENHHRIIASVIYELADCHFQLSEYSLAIANLLPKVNEWRLLPEEEMSNEVRNTFFLLALAFRSTGDYHSAITYLHSYLFSDPYNQLPFVEEALWELGAAHFALGQLKNAKEQWQKIIEINHRPAVGRLARIYLAKSAITEGQYESVLYWLDPIEKSILSDDPFRFEVSYLKGEALFYQHDYVLAAQAFEKSLPKQNKKRAEWYPRALFNLGWSYLKIVEQPGTTLIEQQDALSKAEDAFEQLLEYYRPPPLIPIPILSKILPSLEAPKPKDILEERALIGLARVNLFRYRVTGREQFLNEVDRYLPPKEPFIFIDNQAESLLIRAEACTNYSDQYELYRLLTDTEDYQGTTAYERGWYHRAVSDFQHGFFLLNQNPSEAPKQFAKAAVSFQNSYQLLRQKDPTLAGESLKYQSQAYFYQNTPESRVLGLASLCCLVETEKAIFAQLEERDEILACLGFVAAQLSQETKEEKYLNIAENTLLQACTLYPESRFAPDALYTLATLYYQNEQYERAQPIFEELAKKYPSSAFASEALFWAANCAEEIESDDEIAKNLRKKVFELYPDSPKAPEAYFRIHSFADYLHGNEEAYAHIVRLESLFPNSPYVIVAKYLLGLDKKEERYALNGKLLHPRSLIQSLILLDEAKSTFERFFKLSLIPEDQLDYLTTIRYRAILQHALVSLSLADENDDNANNALEAALYNLLLVRNEFSDSSHPLASRLLEQSLMPRIVEESHFALSQIYIYMDKIPQAEETLNTMIAHYRKAGIEEAYYLSRTWYELGLLAMGKEHFQKALECFDYAEKAGKGGILSVEQKLDLWIQKSHCYKAINEPNLAMLMLSHVINENATSSLRIKAMVLRADIYAMQGRHELAIKQLEVAARKGGNWAQVAKEKLRQDYGFDD